MLLADLFVSLALFAVLVLFLHLLSRGDLWPAPPDSRFELGWPRGVQEEEPVHFRTELLTTASRDRASRDMGATRRPATHAAGRGARIEPALSARQAPSR
jgi:hypothetical protein